MKTLLFIVLLTVSTFAAQTIPLKIVVTETPSIFSDFIKTESFASYKETYSEIRTFYSNGDMLSFQVWKHTIVYYYKVDEEETNWLYDATVECENFPLLNQPLII